MFTFERLRASLSSQSGKKFFATVFVALFVIIGITASLSDVLAQTAPTTPAATPAATAPAQADPGSGACGAEPLNTVCGWIATLLGLFADFIGRLILLVLSVLIAFAQYNDFGNAIPVNEGWVVVRDTTNMFFIVILLLTAFATVIGRDEFHYSKILPKLLLQAVLINFSKTLILLAVDFSQVVMLTFVNAFAQSAAGNFVYALGLDKMMQLGANISGIDVGKIIIAYFLAISFMIIALGVTIILTGYLIYRIVALWVTIIIAPLAFFATAVPDKFKASIGAIGQEYWKRLTNLLTAGPVIAFFLWLTLAVTQKSNQASNAASVDSVAAGQGLAGALNLVRPESAGPQSALGSVADDAVGATFGFLNEIADSAHIASFIVGITMLLMALDTAVASAAVMGGFAAYVGKKTKSLATSVAKLPFTGTAAVAKGSYNAVDRRLDLTRKASLLGTKVLSKTPAMFRGDTYRTLAGGLEKGVNFRRKQAETEAKADADYNKALSSKAKSLDERKALLNLGSAARTQKEGLLPPTMSAKAVESYYQEQYGDKDMIEKEYKATKKKYFDELALAGEKRGLSKEQYEAEAKAGSEVRVREELNERQRQALGARLDIAKSSGNEDEQKKIEELLKLNPHLARTGKERIEAMKNMIDSPELYKDIPKESAMSGEFLTALMMANGWEDVKDDQGNSIGFTEKDKAAWDLKKKEMRRANPAVFEAMEAHERFIGASPDKSSAQLSQIQHVRNNADRTIHSYALRDVEGSSPQMREGVRVRSTKQQAALDSSKREAGSDKAVDVVNMQQAMKYGATLSEVLKNSGYSESDQQPLQSLATEYIGKEASIASEALKSDLAASVALNEKLIQSEEKNYEKLVGQAMKSLEGSELETEIKRLADLRDQAVERITERSDKASSQILETAKAKAQEVISVVNQTNTKGVTRSQQEVVIGEFMKNGGDILMKNIEKYDSDTKQNLLKIAENMNVIANDILKVSAADRTEAQKEFIAGYDKAVSGLKQKGIQGTLKKNLTNIPKTDSAT